VKTYICKSDTEGEGLHEGTITELVIPIAKLPAYYVEGKKPQQYGPAAFAFLDMADPIGTYPTCRVCPYTPGDRIAVKERWRVAGTHNSGFDIQFADGRYRKIENDYEPSYKPAGEWCCASKLAKRWCDTHLLCGSVACREQDGRWVWIVGVKREGD